MGAMVEVEEPAGGGRTLLVVEVEESAVGWRASCIDL